MYLSRIRLRSGAHRNPDFWSLGRDDYKLHKVVWGLFVDGPERRRDFIYRQTEGRAALEVFTVSARRPRDDRGLWEIETKEYQPVLQPGRRLAFILRANPVRTRRDADDKQSRHDVIMEAKTKLKAESRPRHLWPPEQEIVQETGAAWLAGRARQHGFKLAQGADGAPLLRADGYRPRRFFKRDRRITISTVDFDGLLEVTDAERFLQSLLHGIGHAKGFGCGLMLVRSK